MKWKQEVEVETSEYICLVKKIDGVVTEKKLERELVHCKDCKHYWESAGMCTNAKLPVNDSIEPNDYCSRAERKEK